jgi:hypothetical protein
VLDGRAESMNVWENEDARRRERDQGDIVWLIECKEACPNVGGEKRSSKRDGM